jgi:hypothetical protein
MPPTAPTTDTDREDMHMKIIGIIRSNNTEEIPAEGEDYSDERENLLASVPEGYNLLHVRHDC